MSLQSRLLGDGMSILAVQAFVLYTFAHTVRRAPFEKMPPTLHHCTTRPLRLLDEWEGDVDDGDVVCLETAGPSSCRPPLVALPRSEGFRGAAPTSITDAQPRFDIDPFA